MENGEYRVDLEVFEGPLDLLLYLIRKEEVDVYDIPIVRITEQYMAYLEVMRMLDLSIAGEFLVMAATLMMIKSRMLLPEEDRAETEEEDEEEDPRWDLVRRLIEYKKFKDVAGRLEALEEQREDIVARGGEHVELGADIDHAMRDVSLFDLIGAFQRALDNAPREDLREIFTERFTVGEQIDKIIQALERSEKISFDELFGGMASRNEIVCTFLALLELMRLRQVEVRQDRAFDRVWIVPSEGVEPRPVKIAQEE